MAWATGAFADIRAQDCRIQSTDPATIVAAVSGRLLKIGVTSVETVAYVRGWKCER
ncbi:hypothetical protein GCM10023158_34610 [Gluconacetobacter tumulicola]